MLCHGIDTVKTNRIALAVARWGDRLEEYGGESDAYSRPSDGQCCSK